jgi:hypothetical protein
VSLPSPNGPNGHPAGPRDAGGRFRPGNPGGPGNPFARRTARLRTALLKALTPDDVAAVKKLVQRARAGELSAIRELLDRCCGRPKETVEQELAVLDAPAQVKASALDLAPATPAEVEQLRRIRGRIIPRQRCGACAHSHAEGGPPCPEHA